MYFTQWYWSEHNKVSVVKGCPLFQIICGFGIPVDVPRTSLTYGLILKSNYQLPTNATQFTEPYVAFASRTVGASRWHLYRLAETLLVR